MVFVWLHGKEADNASMMPFAVSLKTNQVATTISHMSGTGEKQAQQASAVKTCEKESQQDIALKSEAKELQLASAVKTEASNHINTMREAEATTTAY